MAILTIFGPRPAVRIVEAPVQIVYVRRTWNEPWTWIPWIKVMSCSDGTADGPVSATLQWDFGHVVQAGLWWEDYYGPLTIAGCYVAIWVYDQYGGAPLWIGRISTEQVQPYGNPGAPGGVQTFTAHGLKQILYERPVLGSVALCYAGVGQVDRRLRFNDPAPNRSPMNTDYGPPCFYPSIAGEAPPAEWCNWSIADYLLGFYANGELVGGYGGPRFYLGGFVGPLGTLRGPYNDQWPTVGQALDALIPQGRGLGWRIVTDGLGPCFVDVFSYFLGDNREACDVYAWDPLLESQITLEHTQTYDIVHVIGGTVKICGTWATNDAQFGPLWCMWDRSSGGLEDMYNEIGMLGIGSEAADTQRQAAQFEHVYQAFGVPPYWDWTIGAFNAAPVPDLDGYVWFDRGQSPQFDSGRRFLREIPFYAESPDGVAPELRHAFVLLAVQDSQGTTRYAHVEKLDSLKLHNCSVSLGDQGMIVYIKPPINHIAAKGVWPELRYGEIKNPTKYRPRWSFSNYYLTAMIELDTRLQVVRYVGSRPPQEIPRVKVIEDPDADLVLIAPYTVVDVDAIDSTKTIRTDNLVGCFRDHGPRLRAKADIAVRWYGQQAATVALRIDGITLAHPPGSLIAGLIDGAGYTRIGTVVREREWDFASNKTTIKTGFNELDQSGTGRRKFAEPPPEVRPLQLFPSVVQQPTAPAKVGPWNPRGPIRFHDR